MKRSEVNEIICRADAFIRSFGHILPPFAYWSPEQMIGRRHEIQKIIDARLGWDITDYGAGDFGTMGLFLFTTRNGTLNDLQRGRGMVYAEKIMISRKDQVSPMHRHIIKTEDIINRGGGKIAIQMFESAVDGTIDRNKKVHVACDGISKVLEPGEILRLAPGESVTLHPGNWHKFWGDGADVLIGEVSTVNDDLTDNVFEQPIGRFATIVEDCDPLHLLVSDYEKWLS